MIWKLFSRFLQIQMNQTNIDSYIIIVIEMLQQNDSETNKAGQLAMENLHKYIKIKTWHNQLLQNFLHR